MKRSRTPKDRTKSKTSVQHLPHGNSDQEWFKAHPDRKYRIRPKQHDEPGEGFVIIKMLHPGCRSLVGIGPEGAMLADTDAVLSKMYDIIRSGTSGIIFPHDGSVVSEEEFGS